MDKAFIEKGFPRLRAFNQHANDLPRKGLIVLCVLLGLYLLGVAFPYVAPFVVALLLSSIMEPLLRYLSNETHKVRIPRKLAALLCTLLLVILLVLLITALVSGAFVEIKLLLQRAPGMIAGLVAQINIWLDAGIAWLAERGDFIDETSLLMLKDSVRQLGATAVESAGPLANTVARGALSTAFSMPQVLLFLVLSVMGTYYLASDRERIHGYFRKLVPDSARSLFTKMKTGMARALFGQLRAQVYLTLLMFFELLIGFSVMRIPYALLLALIIGLMDALPVVGTGVFLLPWSLIGFVTGNMFIGVGMLLLYGIVLVMRQLMEPRVVSAQLGVYPLAAMMSMYAGFVLLGFIGMLVGPMAFLLCRVTIFAICGAPEEVQEMLDNPAKRKRVIYIPPKKKKG